MVVQSAEVMEAHIPAAAIVGVVPAEKIEEGTGWDSQNITGAIGEQFYPGAVRAYADHSAPTNLKFATITAGGFHKAEVTGGNINPSIHAKIKPIGGMVGRTLIEIKGNIIDQSTVFFRYAIAIAIVVNRKVGRVENIETVFVPE